MPLVSYVGPDGIPEDVAATSRLPVDIGSATVNLNGDVVAEFDGVEEALGAPADAAASSDTASTGLIGLIKRLLGKLPALSNGKVPVTGPLTDTELRATAVPVAPNVQQGSGVITSTTTRVTLATDGPTVGALTSIDNKTPALSSGRVPVDGSGVTQPVSAASLPLPSGAATATNQATTNTSLSSIDTKTPALQSGAVPIGDNSGSLTVDGKAYRVQLDITRPSNQTAYPAGGVIGTGSGDDAIHTLASIGPSGGYVIIQSIELVLGIASVPSGMTSFRLHFYRTKPTTAAVNASAFDLASADRGAYMGYIDLPAPVDLGATCFTQVDYPGKLFQLGAASTSMFVELQTIGGFTPAANSEVYSLRVKTLEAGL